MRWGAVVRVQVGVEVGGGGIPLFTEAKQKGTVHRSVPQVLSIIDSKNKR